MRPWILGFGGLIACSPQPPTQVLLVLDADPWTRARAETARVILLSADAQVQHVQEEPISVGANATFPLRQPLFPEKGDGFHLVAELDDAQGVFSRLRFIGRYRDGEQIVIEDTFRQSCGGVVSCGDNQTCSDGACAPACLLDGLPECAFPPCLNCPCQEDGCVQGVCVPSIEVSAVSVGPEHVCALANDQTHCWGSRDNGRLGDGLAIDNSIIESLQLTPQLVGDGRFGRPFIRGHSCSIRDGKMWCWGGNALFGASTSTAADVVRPRQRDDEDWNEAGIGFRFTCADKLDGSVWCWGNNEYRTVENTMTNPLRQAQQVLAPGATSRVSAGTYSVSAIVSGTLLSWGRNTDGELGVGGRSDHEPPTQTGTVTDWIDVDRGRAHACGIRTDGTAWCFGSNNRGQLGGTTLGQVSTPTRVDSHERFTRVSCAKNVCCLLSREKELFCFGENEYGQVGEGSTGPDVDRPARVAQDEEWIQVATGGESACALDRHARLWCWGRGDIGQLGRGNRQDRAVPQRVCFSP